MRNNCYKWEQNTTNKFHQVDQSIWLRAESALKKDIKNNKWPKTAVVQKRALENLLAKVCHLSQIGKNLEALETIDEYSFCPLIRFVAINNIKSNSGSKSGKDLIIIRNDIDKLKLYKKRYKITYSKKYTANVKKIEQIGSFGSGKHIWIYDIKDRILQTQLLILLDAYYEPKYTKDVYSYRNGRNPLQAVALLKKIVDSTKKEQLGIIHINTKQCFNTISHLTIMKHFIVPKSWKKLLQSFD